MLFKRGELIKGMELSQPGLTKNTKNEMGKNFIFTGGDILTYNGLVSVLYPFETDFKCAIPYKEFYKIIKNIQEPEIEMSLEGENLKISTYIEGKQKNKIKIAIDKEEKTLEIISSLDINGVLDKLVKIPEDFAKGIGLCAFSASKDLNRPILSSVLIKGDLILSSDGYRISKYKMKNSIQGEKVLIPALAAEEISKLFIQDYFIADSWAFFYTNEDILFFCKIIKEEEINDYESFFGEFSDFEEISFPSDIKEMLKLNSSITDENYENVTVMFEGENFKCKSQNASTWIESQSKSSFVAKQPISFLINPEFLMQIIDMGEKVFYKENKILFKGESFEHIIALNAE